MTAPRMTEILNNLGEYVSNMQTAAPQPEDVQSMAACIRNARREIAQLDADLLEARETLAHYRTLLATRERDLCNTINTLTREGVEQRLTIKALADALLEIREWSAERGPPREEVKARCDAALRRAERLPLPKATKGECA